MLHVMKAHSKWQYVLAGTLLGFLLIASVNMYHFQMREEARATVIMTCTVLRQFIEQHDRWPDSWDELERFVPYETNWPLHGWPRDSWRSRQCARIPFGHELCREDSDSSVVTVEFLPPFDRHVEYRSTLDQLLMDVCSRKRMQKEPLP